MNSTHDNTKIGKVKTIIKGSAYSNFQSLLKKLHDADPLITKIKYQYSYSQPDLLFLPLTMKTKGNVPKWFVELIPSLEKYLNVAIVRDKRLIGNEVEPIYSLSVIGDKDMGMVAIHYIDTMFTTISRLVGDKRKVLTDKAKINRRRTRNGESTVPTEDAREGASRYKRTLILSIINTINLLLESCQKNYPVSWRNGLKRDDYIQTQLKLKYSNTWRSGLSNRYG